MKEGMVSSINAINILKVLWQHSDRNNALTQKQIIAALGDDYKIERKTVGRTIEKLCDIFNTSSLPIKIKYNCKEDDADIENHYKGVYLEKPFKDSELRLLIDSVLTSRHINSDDSKELIKKLCMLSNRDSSSLFKRVNTVNNIQKTEAKGLFDNIDILSNAIEKQKKVRFDYIKYRDGAKSTKGKSHVVSPYELWLHGQYYYLISNDEEKGKTNFRVDRIENVKILTEHRTPFEDVYGSKEDFPYKKMTTAYPYMFTDEPQRIEFVLHEDIRGDVFDYFGNAATITAQPDGKYKVSVYTSPMAMEIWALKYLMWVEILSPQSLRDKIIEDLKGATAKYKI